jgi:hypothetical protein
LALYVGGVLLASVLGSGCGEEDENEPPTVSSITVENPGNGESALYDGVQGTAYVNASDSDGSVVSGTVRVNGGSAQSLDGALTAPVTATGESATLEAEVTDNEGAKGSRSTTVPVYANESQIDNDAIGAQIAAWQSASSIVAGWTNMDLTLSGGGTQTLDGVIFDNNFTYRGIEGQGETQTTADLDAIGAAVGADGVPTELLPSDTLSNLQAYLAGVDPNSMGTVKSAKSATPKYDGPGPYELPDADDSTWADNGDGERVYESLLSNGALERITETSVDGRMRWVREVEKDGHLLGRQIYIDPTGEGAQLVSSEAYGAVVASTGAVLLVSTDSAGKPQLTVAQPGTPVAPTVQDPEDYKPSKDLQEVF